MRKILLVAALLTLPLAACDQAPAPAPVAVSNDATANQSDELSSNSIDATRADAEAVIAQARSDVANDSAEAAK